MFSNFLKYLFRKLINLERKDNLKHSFAFISTQFYAHRFPSHGDANIVLWTSQRGYSTHYQIVKVILCASEHICSIVRYCSEALNNFKKIHCMY